MTENKIIEKDKINKYFKSKKFKRNDINYLIIVGLFLVFFIMQLTGTLKYSVKALLITTVINIILAVSLNLLVGFLGELTLGHAGFMCIGAFIGKLISMQMPEVSSWVSFPICILAGGIAAALFGFIIGLPTMRLRGDYLAIVTLAFGEIIRNVILNIPVFGGAKGLIGGKSDTTYIICFAVLLISVIIIQNIVNSRHGRAIRAIKNNDIAARSIGIDITFYKLITFVISAFFAGVAGVLYSHNVTILQSSTFDYNKSIEILVFVVLGGMGSITGSIIAATAITLIPELLRFLQDYRMLIYSIVLIIVMLCNASPRFKAFTEKVKEYLKVWFTKLVTPKKEKIENRENLDNNEENIKEEEK